MPTRERKQREQQRDQQRSERAAIEARVLAQAADELADRVVTALEQDKRAQQIEAARQKRYARKPWDQIELWYVTNAYATFTEVSRRWQIEVGFVRRHAAKHGWTTKQAAFRAEVTRRVYSECAARLAAQVIDEAAPFVESLMRTGRALLDRTFGDCSRKPDDLPAAESYEKGFEVRGTGKRAHEVEVMTRRRAPNLGNALNRTIVRTAAEFVLKFGGYEPSPGGEKSRDVAEAKQQGPDVPTGPSGTPQDFHAAMQDMVGVMLGPGVAAAAAQRALPERASDAKP